MCTRSEAERRYKVVYENTDGERYMIYEEVDSIFKAGELLAKAKKELKQGENIKLWMKIQIWKDTGK